MVYGVQWSTGAANIPDVTPGEPHLTLTSKEKIFQLSVAQRGARRYKVI
jgi:hypothetical protein